VPRIAISYRRADTDAIAGRIRDRLAGRYGEDAVFMDIDDIPYGKDFRVHISEAIVQSDILLVIIGQGWLGAAEDGTRRIDDETDFVRLEVETAISNAIPVIPVLVGPARMPQPTQLPESLKNFAFLNAAPVDTSRDFHQHMERLIRGIDQVPNRRAANPDIARPLGEAAAPVVPASANRDADADRRDLVVFHDAPFAPELVVIPAGEFMMGSAQDEGGHFESEWPQHHMAIGRRFAIGRYPVTFDEYDRFCNTMRREKPGDAGWGRERRPVINVSWQDAQAYIVWLSQETRHTYRLPSEAEWEYACRAGTTTRYSFGDMITPKDANYTASGLLRTSVVGAYLANAWLLHDMHGNVWEWVEDDWRDDYRGTHPDGAAWKNPVTSSNIPLSVLRGGSWTNGSSHCRSAFRYGYRAAAQNSSVGFRVARTLS
jgi:formylglycine-generating enzyme required for sulfatase activity